MTRLPGADASGESRIPDALVGPVYSSVSPLRAAEIMAFGSVSAGQLSRAMSCNERTARRVLERLADEGWAHRIGAAPRRYSLSLRAAAMGAQAMSRSAFALRGVRLVEELDARASRAAFIAVPCYDQLLCIAGSDRSPIRRGALLPVAGSAAGLILLAHRPRWRDQLPSPIAGDERVLEEVRRLGHARLGHDIAMPVPWDGEGVLGAVTLIEMGPRDVAMVELAGRVVAEACAAMGREAA